MGQQQAVKILMETLVVCAQMLCWPLHTGYMPEEEAEASYPRLLGLQVYSVATKKPLQTLYLSLSLQKIPMKQSALLR